MVQDFNENMIYVKKGEVQYLQFKKLLPYEDIVKHAFAVKELGYRTMNANTEVAIQNYHKLCDALNLDYKNVVKPLQVHSGEVKVVTEKFAKEEPDINLIQYKETDGVVTNQKNRILSTTSADCVLILFFDPVKKVIGNVHAGWRGTFKKIAGIGVQKMIEAYGCNPKDILCFLCPSIHSCHFEVQKDVKEVCEKVLGHTGKLEQIIEEKIAGEKWTINLVEANKVILQELGILQENIVDSGVCSVCHSDIIHSCRADSKEFNLNTAIISLI